MQNERKRDPNAHCQSYQTDQNPSSRLQREICGQISRVLFVPEIWGRAGFEGNEIAFIGVREVAARGFFRRAAIWLLVSVLTLPEEPTCSHFSHSDERNFISFKPCSSPNLWHEQNPTYLSTYLSLQPATRVLIGLITLAVSIWISLSLILHLLSCFGVFG
eukprot:TRINITY_DN4607_c0_g1_i11.p1 TRINITY_DN4607_c0_g1~~TRINITY_DN4607_c0_g1_i11.p1  ORF type:complete len:161 (-),score=17.73 TRINITY_DN4607_c0_g1_i11:1132-1614(-)